MADANNPGQFGNRDDTEEQARQGGQNSSGQNGADPQEAGAEGAEAQPREAKVEGGKKGVRIVKITTRRLVQKRGISSVPF